MKPLIFRLFFISLLLSFGIARCQTYDGYTLYFPQNGTKAYLVDLSGNTYHQWTFNSNSATCYATYLLSGGVLLRTVNHAGNYFNGGPISGEVQKVDWNGNVLWDFIYSTQDYCTHHDICGMPNGNVLLIAYERKTAAQAVQAGCALSIEMWPDKIVEIQPSGTNGGTVVWEWHAWNHLVQDHDATKDNYGVVANHPELLNINYNTSKDWMHMNGIDYNPVLDQITFSSHALNEIYVIDHSTTIAQAASHTGGNSGKGGDLLYRWGNPAAYQTAGTTYFNVVHDAHWVPEDDPRFPNALSGYNNKGGAGNKTCVDIINPPYNGYNYYLTPGSAYQPSIYTWRHTYSGNQSQDNGNSQQLPNGNTLVCIGMSGFIYEIDSNQVQVWSKSVGGTLPQSYRYPPCYVNSTYTATASGLPETICSGGTVQLDVTASGGDVYIYNWTSNPAGFTSNIKNPVVTPTVTTTYTVTIKNGPCSATDAVTITVNQLPPAPTITQTGDSLISSASSGNQWFLNNNAIPGATGQILVPSSNGSYQVQVTDINNCTSPLSETFNVTWMGTEQMTNMEAFSVFPNPTTGIITITASSFNTRYFETAIFNSIGRQLMNKQNSRIIDLSEFENGIYYLTIKSLNNKLVTRKIVLIK
ncbi:MAG: aryl-sulfate sulfotransferase [Bacteroidetes bacterium]|nr:aryl-sulfate sulfotransferase [Bacteroidota bacterium]